MGMEIGEGRTPVYAFGISFCLNTCSKEGCKSHPRLLLHLKNFLNGGEFLYDF